MGLSELVCEKSGEQVTALQICRPLKRAFLFKMNREPSFHSSADADGALPHGQATAPLANSNQSFVART